MKEENLEAEYKIAVEKVLEEYTERTIGDFRRVDKDGICKGVKTIMFTIYHMCLITPYFNGTIYDDECNDDCEICGGSYDYSKYFSFFKEIDSKINDVCFDEFDGDDDIMASDIEQEAVKVWLAKCLRKANVKNLPKYMFVEVHDREELYNLVEDRYLRSEEYMQFDDEFEYN